MAQKKEKETVNTENYVPGQAAKYSKTARIIANVALVLLSVVLLIGILPVGIVLVAVTVAYNMIQSKAVKAYSADLERLTRYQTITDAEAEAASIRDVAKQDADQMKSVAYEEATHMKEDAQQYAAQTKNTAEVEAAQIVAEAQRKAEEIAGDAKRAIAEAAARASEFSEVQSKLATAKSQLVEVEEEVLMQSFGLYKPQFSFATSAEYKVRLNDLRAKEKAMLKDGTAATGSSTWTVNGSEAEGRKMTRDMQKLLLRAFNGECDVLVEKVKFNNLEATEKRMVASRDAISKLGTIVKVSITPAYFSLKVQELHLAYEYQVKKQEEKEAAKEARQKQREEAKAAKELENARKKLEKEQNHYSNALSRLDAQIQGTTDEKELADLKQKKAEMETQLATIDQEMKDVDYRSANQKAGYVYIISNIGAFGEDVYKIGMTRRLDPMDRVDELGDASVPFNFDVHAMIFTDDAPGLEAALHNAFADRKVNFVNQRREFFNVTLDEIKKVVRENYDKTVEFVDVPPAEQYRESLLMRQQQTA